LAIDDIWRVYHLMRGGIESPLTLESLAGVSVKGIDLNALYLWADETWIRSLTLSVRLPEEKSVICARCNRVCRTLPCRDCERHGRGANWLGKKTTALNVGKKPDKEDPVYWTNLRYHGYAKDDV
jgi:hypothetical protein